MVLNTYSNLQIRDCDVRKKEIRTTEKVDGVANCKNDTSSIVLKSLLYSPP